MTPLSDVRNEFTMAIAAGAVRIHGEESKTKGSISFGVEIKQNFTADVIYEIGDGDGADWLDPLLRFSGWFQMATWWPIQ